MVALLLRKGQFRMRQSPQAQGKMRRAVSLSAVSPPLELVALSLVAVLLSLIIPLLSAEVAHANAKAPTVPLGTCQALHCYAVAEWPGGTGSQHPGTGAYVQHDTEGLSVTNINNHISEEMWALDWAHPCYISPGVLFENSSIEAGEGIGGWIGSQTSYFWEDCRPGYLPAHHWMYAIPSGDYGQTFAYTIVNTSNWGTSQGTWDIYMQSLNGTQHWQSHPHTSTAMSFKPNAIWAGLEAYPQANLSYADANPVDYSQNQWRNASGAWAYQTSAGYVESDPNANWTWLTVPAPGGFGGDGEATCC
jgi:hypothetical protein